MAGTDDPDKVAQALRSGNLEWDSAWGPLRIATNGIGEVNMHGGPGPGGGQTGQGVASVSDSQARFIVRQLI